MTEHYFKVTCYSICTQLMQHVLPVSTCHSSVRPDAVLLVASRPWKGIQRIYNVMLDVPTFLYRDKNRDARLRKRPIDD